jgi:hypothetical protein
VRISFALFLLLVLSGGASAQTAIIGDAWVLGRVMVGTTTPSARMTVAPSSSTLVPFQTSGVDLTPFLRVGADGSVGLSTYSAAHVEVAGSGDSGNVGVELRAGNLYGGAGGNQQIAFGSNGTTNERHAINSVHLSSTVHNSLNFMVWTPDAGTTNIATMTVLSLVSISTASGAAVHVRPVGEPTVELVVSNGASTGGGTIHVANQVTPSSRALKTGIAYLSDAERQQAYDDVKGLRHASFKYMKRKAAGYERDKHATTHRGLIYEEAPAGMRGPGESLSLDQRLLESEMAFQELVRRLEKLDAEVAR